MAYADYEFYTTSYFGSAVPETDFPRLAERASDFVDTMTFDRKNLTLTLSKPVKIKDGEGNEVEIDSELTIEVNPPEEDGPYADITIYIDLPPIVEAAGRVVAGFINAKSHSKIHLAPAIPH